ncbi:hypothetical protein MTO96_006594 [Rhipicephalus appendiculatus]
MDTTEDMKRLDTEGLKTEVTTTQRDAVTDSAPCQTTTTTSAGCDSGQEVVVAAKVHVEVSPLDFTFRTKVRSGVVSRVDEVPHLFRCTSTDSVGPWWLAPVLVIPGPRPPRLERPLSSSASGAGAPLGPGPGSGCVARAPLWNGTAHWTRNLDPL